MYRITICLLLFWSKSFVSFAQTIDLNFTQSDEHVEIPGTKYSIIPPDESYSISSNFHGLQTEDEKSAINITEMPMPFATVLPMFAKDIPANELTEEKDYMINGNSVKLYKSKRLINPDIPESEVMFYTMLYGNEKTTFMIAATYESAKEEILSSKFENSLLSFMYMEGKEVDPQDGLSFSLDMSNTPLQFASVVMQTGAAYNMDGEMFKEKEDATNYMVMIMPVEIEEAEQKDKAIRGVKKSFDENINVEEVNPVTLDGLNGYEVVAYEQGENDEVKLKYAVALFEKDKYYDIRASSEIDLEKRLEMFKMISRTFKLK